MMTSHFHVYGKMIAYDVPVVKQCRNLYINGVGDFVLTEEIYILEDCMIDGINYRKGDKFPKTADSCFIED